MEIDPNETNARPLVRREVAERHLARFLDRVREVNDSSYWLFLVDRVLLFGSMLDAERERVRDVDLAVDLVPRTTDADLHQTRMVERSAEAAQRGRRFKNVTERVAWGELEVYRFLKARSPYLSITSTDDPVLALTPWQVVYGRTQPRRPEPD
jgi:predicted nucleotidyltransferase